MEQYTRSTTEIEALVAAQSDNVQSSIVLGYFQVKYPVSDYLLTYEDDKDEDKSKFTAKISVPSGTQNCSTFIYFHESEVFHKAVPTERPICNEVAFAGLCMFNNLAATYAITASAGYCVVLPDLEGLGNSASYPGIHPYGQLGKQNNHVGILLDAYEEFLLKNPKDLMCI